MPLPNKKVAMIARWKPVHNGHQAVLVALSTSAENVLLGIGSSNRYDLRNPFTFEETRAMIGLVLPQPGKTDILAIPDLDDGPRWRKMVKELLGELDLFVTDNPYVTSLLKEDYRIQRPVELIPPDMRVQVDGTAVRRAMARGEEWEMLVPPAVANYIKSNHLDQRFREQFGLQTLALETIIR